MVNGKFLTAKEIAGKYGLSYQVINHYSDLGLLSIAHKKGTLRLYDRRSVEKRMRQIAAMAREGYSLRLIRKKILGI